MLLLSVLLAVVALVSTWLARNPKVLLRLSPDLSRKDMRELGLAGNRFRNTVRNLFTFSAIVSALAAAYCLVQWRHNRDLAAKQAPQYEQRVEKMKKHSQGSIYVELQKGDGKGKK